MESSKKLIVKVQEVVQEDQLAKIIQWEDYEQELVRLCSLTSALEEANSKKSLLIEKLQPLIETESESLRQSNELDDMLEKLEHRNLLMGKMFMHSKVLKEKVRKQEEQLSGKIRSLLAGGRSLSVANKHFQDSSRSWYGDKGSGHCKNLLNSLRIRQQYMVSEISLLYPVKLAITEASEQELESFRSSRKSGVPDGSKPVDQGTLTISGLHFTLIYFKKMSFFTDKKEVQRSSTALGYVAHAVSLIASYLQVPLRYPLRLGGSRSHIRDHSPSVEHSAPTSSLNSLTSTSTKPVEFPLFIEGQDSTRASYGVFLLNKDLEQLLNFIGVKSLGPRHILANLKELTRTIQCPDYIDM